MRNRWREIPVYFIHKRAASCNLLTRDINSSPVHLPLREMGHGAFTSPRSRRELNTGNPITRRKKKSQLFIGGSLTRPLLLASQQALSLASEPCQSSRSFMTVQTRLELERTGNTTFSFLWRESSSVVCGRKMMLFSIPFLPTLNTVPGS